MGFFTKLSKRQEDQKLFRFYLGVLGLVLAAIFVFILGVYFLKQEHRFWPGQQMTFIILASVFAFLMLVVRVFRQTNDAYGFTHESEKYFIIHKILSITIVAAFFITNSLNLTTFYIHHLVVFIFILFLWSIHFNKRGIKPWVRSNKMTSLEINSYIREFYQYCHPLFIYSLVGLIAGIGGRWLLQTFSGSEEQGFFSLAYRVGMIVLLFTKSMTPLFTREFSVAQSNHDFDRMRFLFKKSITLFYSIATAISMIVAYHGARIGVILGGSEFQQAGIAISLMAFYPIHQVYGQLNAAVFYATDQTKLYRNIGISVKILGLAVTYFFVAPVNYGGLNLGAVGVAFSAIIVQFIGVNIQLFFNTRLLNFSFLKFFCHQLLVFLICGLFAFISDWLIRQLFAQDLLQLISSTVIYFIFIFVLFLKFPRIISMNQNELKNRLKNLTREIIIRK